MAETVLYEKQGNVVVMTLNRPAALNSINRQLRRELAEAITQFDGESDAYVGIITGAGRAFCAGRDLKERASDNEEGVQARARDSMYPDRPYMWPQTWKPLIAAVNGYALAGGWSIAQMCDLRIAAEDAQLGITETKWSLLPPFGTILTKMLPLSAVLELCMTAQPITAQRAYDIGFLNKVVPAEQSDGRGDGLGRHHRRQRAAGGAVFQGTGLPGVEYVHPGHILADLPYVRPVVDHRGLQGRPARLRRKTETELAGAVEVWHCRIDDWPGRPVILAKAGIQDSLP